MDLYKYLPGSLIEILKIQIVVGDKKSREDVSKFLNEKNVPKQKAQDFYKQKIIEVLDKNVFHGRFQKDNNDYIDSLAEIFQYAIFSRNTRHFTGALMSLKGQNKDEESKFDENDLKNIYSKILATNTPLFKEYKKIFGIENSEINLLTLLLSTVTDNTSTSINGAILDIISTLTRRDSKDLTKAFDELNIDFLINPFWVTAFSLTSDSGYFITANVEDTAFYKNALGTLPYIEDGEVKPQNKHILASYILLQHVRDLTEEESEEFENIKTKLRKHAKESPPSANINEIKSMLELPRNRIEIFANKFIEKVVNYPKEKIKKTYKLTFSIINKYEDGLFYDSGNDPLVTTSESKVNAVLEFQKLNKNKDIKQQIKENTKKTEENAKNIKKMRTEFEKLNKAFQETREERDKKFARKIIKLQGRNRQKTNALQECAKYYKEIYKHILNKLNGVVIDDSRPVTMATLDLISGFVPLGDPIFKSVNLIKELYNSEQSRIKDRANSNLSRSFNGVFSKEELALTLSEALTAGLIDKVLKENITDKQIQDTLSGAKKALDKQFSGRDQLDLISLLRSNNNMDFISSIVFNTARQFFPETRHHIDPSKVNTTSLCVFRHKKLQACSKGGNNKVKISKTKQSLNRTVNRQRA